MTRDQGAGESTAALAGMRVLVTRPAGQCQGLIEAIEARGGEAVVMPLVEIAPPRDEMRAKAALARAAHFDLVIFVSRNAVERGLALAGRAPARGVAAVGRATAAALRAAGVAEVLVPRSANDSEALLAMEALAEDAVRGRRVLIVKGEGGRDLLGETLTARGAEVAFADVYRRRPPGAISESALRDARADAIVITSTESFENLLASIGESARTVLEKVAFVAISERVARHVRAAGVGKLTVVARRADDEALAEAVVAWRRGAMRCEGGKR